MTVLQIRFKNIQIDNGGNYCVDRDIPQYDHWANHVFTNDCPMHSPERVKNPVIAIVDNLMKSRAPLPVKQEILTSLEAHIAEALNEIENETIMGGQ